MCGTVLLPPPNMSTLCGDDCFLANSSFQTVKSPQFAAVMKDLDVSTANGSLPSKPSFPQTPVIKITFAAEEDDTDMCKVTDDFLAEEEEPTGLENNECPAAQAWCAVALEEDRTQCPADVGSSLDKNATEQVGSSEAVGRAAKHGPIVQGKSAGITEDASREGSGSPSSSPKARRGTQLSAQDSANRVKVPSPPLPRRQSVGQFGGKRSVSPAIRRRSFGAFDQNAPLDTGSNGDSCQREPSGRKQSASRIVFSGRCNGDSTKPVLQQVKKSDKIDLSLHVSKTDKVTHCGERRDVDSRIGDSNRGNKRSPLPRRKTLPAVERDRCDEEEDAGYSRQRNASFPGTGVLLRRRSTVEGPAMLTKQRSPPERRRDYSETGNAGTMGGSDHGKPQCRSRRVTVASSAPLLQLRQPSISRSCSDIQQLLADEESRTVSRTRASSSSAKHGSSSPPHPPSGSPVLPRMERRIYLSAATSAPISQKSKSWEDLRDATMSILKEASRDDGIPKEALPQISMEEVLRSWKTTTKHYNMISSVINPRAHGSVDLESVKDCRYIRKSSSS